MANISRALCAAALLVLTVPVRADEDAAKALVDKAIKAIGGEEAIAKIKAFSIKSKGTIRLMGNDNEVATTITSQGIDHFRSEMDGEFGGNRAEITTGLAGDKGFRAYGGNMLDLSGDALANQKRTVYLQVIPITLVALKTKDFKIDTVPDDKVGDKPVAGIVVTPADKKEFKLYFDKETGLPAKTVAKVAGFRGDGDFIQETTFTDYKETAGIKKAMKVVSTRDGEKFTTQEVLEFKILDKVDPKLFTDAL
jgi:hypothetical protein